MKKDKLLLALLVLLLLLLSPRSVRAGGQQVCIVLVDPASKVVQQLNRLHTFIDAVPDTAKLDLVRLPLPFSRMPQPQTLDRETRAALHLELQQVEGQASATERQLIDAVQQSIRVLASMSGERVLILASDNVSQSDSWHPVIADAVENDVQVVLLTGDANDSAYNHPLVRQTMGRQIGVTGTLLPDLLQVCGLLSADLEPTGSQDHAVSFNLQPDALHCTVYFSQAANSGLQVTSPTGRSFSLNEAAPGSVYSGSDYTCWHLAKEQAADYGWEGSWLINSAGQGQVGVWLVDSIELKVEISVKNGQRLLTTSVWRLGNRLTSAELRGQEFRLLSSNGEGLIALNDAGIGGDLVPGDGVFGVALPEHILPAAGSAIVQAEGRIRRASSVYVDAIPKLVSAARRPDLGLVTSSLLILTGLTGALLAARKRPAEMILRHISAAGYQQVIPLGSQPLTAGSGRKSRIRICAASESTHLRFRASRKGVIIDVLAAEPGTYINGERVYLSRTLEHGDEISIGTDTIIFQDRRRSRIGRRVALSRQENGA